VSRAISDSLLFDESKSTAASNGLFRSLEWLPEMAKKLKEGGEDEVRKDMEAFREISTSFLSLFFLFCSWWPFGKRGGREPELTRCFCWFPGGGKKSQSRRTCGSVWQAMCSSCRSLARLGENTSSPCLFVSFNLAHIFTSSHLPCGPSLMSVGFRYAQPTSLAPVPWSKDALSSLGQKPTKSVRLA
jgi:hypothetical protein